jgi:hypothetical protein
MVAYLMSQSFFIKIMVDTLNEFTVFANLIYIHYFISVFWLMCKFSGRSQLFVVKIFATAALISEDIFAKTKQDFCKHAKISVSPSSHANVTLVCVFLCLKWPVGIIRSHALALPFAKPVYFRVQGSALPRTCSATRSPTVRTVVTRMPAGWTRILTK